MPANAARARTSRPDAAPGGFPPMRTAPPRAAAAIAGRRDGQEQERQHPERRAEPEREPHRTAAELALVTVDPGAIVGRRRARYSPRTTWSSPRPSSASIRRPRPRPRRPLDDLLALAGHRASKISRCARGADAPAAMLRHARGRAGRTRSGRAEAGRCATTASVDTCSGAPNTTSRISRAAARRLPLLLGAGYSRPGNRRTPGIVRGLVTDRSVMEESFRRSRQPALCANDQPVD